MTYDELKTEFFCRIQPLKYSDTAQLNKKCSEILGRLVSENALEIDDISGSCKKILREYYEYMNETNARLQKELDEKNGLKIVPQKADFPSERVEQIAKSLKDPTVPSETIQRRARSAVENVANSFHDDYVRKNAEFRSKAGIKCHIVRETNGKCCAWCSALAGRYVYGDEPDDIFRRHDNCTCTVTFENGHERQNVLTKEKWQVSPVLKLPYKPLAFDKNQAENLQKIQLAKYIGLDKSSKSDIIEETTNAIGVKIKIVDKTDIVGEPNSITQKVSKKGGIERNYYGEDGKQTKQIANNNHGNPKQHPFGEHGEHAHDYIYDENGKLIGRPVRELNDIEKKENGDIL